MYYRIIRNDILRSKTITLTTMFFIAAAAMLVSLAAILAVNLTGAIDALMTQAETPHFMQMHSGSVDTARLAGFVAQNGGVAEYQVLAFLNVDSARIVIDGNSLAGSLQDNGLTTQSEQFDYLLDLDGKVIQASDGEIYVPISYMKDGSAQVGDRVVISGKPFTVAGFLRDSQMNSLLSSSKRFLVSAKDYAEIKNSGSVEYLIEFRLKDVSALRAFETAYTAAGLEANGPTITYPLFRTINAISDGLMIGVILLLSALVVAVAFLCIRFTLLAKIEEDYREIGVMKAIGLRVSDIRTIYLAKYAAIAAVGSVLGFALSFAFRDLLLENIRLFMGDSGDSSTALLFGITGVLLVFLALMAYVGNVLQRFRKRSAADAIRFGASQEKSGGAKHFTLSKTRLPDTNLFLGIQDVLARKRIYATMLAVLVISAFIMLVPQNLYSTISSEGFVTYMGIGKCDMRIDIQQTSMISEKAAGIEKAMESDPSISRFTVLTTKTFNVRQPGGSEERIKVELGDHSVFPISYSEGRAPAANDEIALSVMSAGELGKKPGDFMTLVIEGEEKKLIVSGIYSDITNGGKTAKANFTDSSADTMWSVICAELTDKSLIGGRLSEYARKFDFAKVSGIEEYIEKTFASTMNSIEMASIVAIAVAQLLILLIVLLFMKMLVAKDRYSIVAMKAFGFTNRDIAMQYVFRSVFVLIVGMVLGTLLANTLGEALAGAVLSSLGASSFQFEVNPVFSYLLGPLLMACSALIATIAGTSNAGRIKLSENIKE